MSDYHIIKARILNWHSRLRGQAHEMDVEVMPARVGTNGQFRIYRKVKGVEQVMVIHFGRADFEELLRQVASWPPKPARESAYGESETEKLEAASRVLQAAPDMYAMLKRIWAAVYGSERNDKLAEEIWAVLCKADPALNNDTEGGGA